MKVAMNEKELAIEAPLVVSRIFKNCLYSGFFGQLDSARIKVITDKMLKSIELYNSEYMIIDLSNVDLIDTAIAGHLIKISVALRLSGVKVILCGIKGYVAQTMSVIDIRLDVIEVVKDVEKALQFVYTASGYELIENKAG